MNSASWFTQKRVALQSLLATIPLMVYFRDQFFSVTCVKGTSMEPTIQSGDIILIRKRDAGSFLLNVLNTIGFVSLSNKDDVNSKGDGILSTKKIEEKMISLNRLNNSNVDRERAKIYRLEDDSSYMLISPAHLSPFVLPGHVIVYRNPYAIQEYLVKRVIGIGGQRISTLQNDRSTTTATTNNDNNRDDVTTDDNALHKSPNEEESSAAMDCTYIVQSLHRRKKEDEYYYDLRLPPHFLYTEGDNKATSKQDSRSQDNQPITQNLVIGIAEYILWPPSRFQRIRREPVTEMDPRSNISRPRAIWDK